VYALSRAAHFPQFESAIREFGISDFLVRMLEKNDKPVQTGWGRNQVWWPSEIAIAILRADTSVVSPPSVTTLQNLISDNSSVVRDVCCQWTRWHIDPPIDEDSFLSFGNEWDIRQFDYQSAFEHCEPWEPPYGVGLHISVAYRRIGQWMRAHQVTRISTTDPSDTISRFLAQLRYFVSDDAVAGPFGPPIQTLSVPLVPATYYSDDNPYLREIAYKVQTSPDVWAHSHRGRVPRSEPMHFYYTHHQPLRSGVQRFPWGTLFSGEYLQCPSFQALYGALLHTPGAVASNRNQVRFLSDYDHQESGHGRYYQHTEDSPSTEQEWYQQGNRLRSVYTSQLSSLHTVFSIMLRTPAAQSGAEQATPVTGPETSVALPALSADSPYQKDCIVIRPGPSAVPFDRYQ
jgi:hypothetical protein